MGKIAIQGFGRIGRSALKAALKADLFSPVAISDVKDLDNLAALFKADSNYGLWPEDVSVKGDKLTIGGREITYYDVSKGLPNWGDMGIDVVVDCTGRAVTRQGAQPHLDAGAKHVLVSAASKSTQDADAILMLGINDDQYDASKHQIVSMASCTTNALGAVVKVLIDTVGIKSAFFSTVHAYTNTQSLTDQPMKDRRDSWAAAENIIPSSSGAAKALLFIWPDLKITGKAYRVPTRTGSIAEVNAVVNRNTTADEIKDAYRKAAASGPLKGIMSVLEEEWASARIVGESHSSIIDLPLIQVLDNNLVSVAAWYDNEMGYSTRLAEMAARMAK